MTEETAPELDGNDNVAEVRRPRRVAAADGKWRRRYVNQCLEGVCHVGSPPLNIQLI